MSDLCVHCLGGDYKTLHEGKSYSHNTYIESCTCSMGSSLNVYMRPETDPSKQRVNVA